MKRALSLLLVLCLVLGLSLPVRAATEVTGYTKAEDVKYVYNTSKNYISNWGAREEDCVFLSPKALTFYTGSYTYANFSSMDGGTGTSSAPSSALYRTLQSFMADKQTYQTSYSATRDLYKYTDCTLGDSRSISSFYSGVAIGPDWDSGATWNREHTWPNSKGDASGNGENDIMMLRPASVSENSSRGNKAYGKSSGYYNPNSESGGKYDLRGDVSRIMLYVYVRWGNTGSMWGSSGVIESLDVLLEWMEEDPVDTWEMGRNDSVQSITGTRNVFVDYPELAWLLFGEEIPQNMTTPSGMAKNGSGTTPPACTHSNTEIQGYVAATCTQTGYTGDTYCKDCGEKRATGTVIPQLAHTNENGDNKCDNCGSTDVVCSHSKTTLKNTKDATCTEEGYTGDTYCSYCDRKISSGKTVPTTSHVNTDGDKKCDNCGSTDVKCGHRDTTLEGAKAATCTSIGYTGDERCTLCNKVIKYGSIINKLDHTNTDGDNKCDNCGSTDVKCGHRDTKPEGVKAATCTSIGYTGDERCTLCNKVINYGSIIPSLGHLNNNNDHICDRCNEPIGECNHSKTEIYGAKDATCSEAGYTGDTYCTDCGEKLSDGTAIDQLSHINKDGNNRCDNCGSTDVDCGHGKTELRDAKEATCTTSGQKADTYCFYCDNLLKNGETIDKLEHTWIAADCENPKTCSVCNETEGSALGHKLTATKEKEATCTTSGNKAYYTCEVCKNVYSDKYGVNETTIADMTVPATGHTDSNKDLRCDVCKASICKTHSWADATCEKAKTCTNCGEVEGRPLGHDWTDADCETAKTCSVCNQTAGDPLGHDWTDATCTTPETCKRCNSVKGNATGHIFGQWQNGKRVCAVCGHQETEDQSSDCPHPETVLRNEKAATCTKDGYTGDLYCVDCGTITSTGSAIIATGHTDSDGDHKCDACSADTNCSHTETELKDAKDATCVADGYTGDSCCVSCGEVITPGQVIPATGEHHFGEWISNEDLSSRTCEDCGYVETEYNTPTDPSVPGETQPSETQPAPTEPSASAPTEAPTTGSSATEPSEPAPAPSFPVVPVIIVIVILAIGAVVILILKKKKAE